MWQFASCSREIRNKTPQKSGSFHPLKELHPGQNWPKLNQNTRKVFSQKHDQSVCAQKNPFHSPCTCCFCRWPPCSPGKGHNSCNIKPLNQKGTCIKFESHKYLKKRFYYFKPYSQEKFPGCSLISAIARYIFNGPINQPAITIHFK